MHKILIIVILLLNQCLNSQVLISEIYGGGGNSGAPFNQDYISITNYGGTIQNINGWSLQYAASTSTFNSKVNLSGNISPGEVIYICYASGGMNGGPLPFTCNFTSSTNLNMIDGKVALANNMTTVDNTAGMVTPGSGNYLNVVDFVGYGNSANQYEGSGPTARPSNTKSVIRIQETNNNSSDFTTQTLMPVIIKEYQIYFNNNKTHISFSTASETNNDYFTIERAADDMSFEAIGMITGAGNSNTEIRYQFTDDKPMKGMNYYRIKQTDFDGKFTYSAVKSVRYDRGERISISPQMTEGRLHLTTTWEDYTISIINSAGQEMKRFPSMSLSQSISIDELQTGLYFLRATNGAEIETLKIIKI